MKRTVFAGLFILLVFLSFCKSSGNDSTSDASFTVNGTVFIDSIPTSTIQVELSVGTVSPRTYTKSTDSEGKYTFTETTGRPNNYSAFYSVRAMNPGTGAWSDEQAGRCPLDEIVIHDFYFFTG